ncbi:helix-turn-helix domain-containing protein [Streptomyces sp. NPDC051555]|uniref:helix-turn-helix domain-containing protein n=1 Tax=Streptomyces sp. NPDC051555 TaxID=3365657 RepID=UPI0037B19652
MSPSNPGRFTPLPLPDPRARAESCLACAKEPPPTAPGPGTDGAHALVLYTGEALSKAAGAFYSAAIHTAPGPSLLAQLHALPALLENAEAAVIHRARLDGESWNALAAPLDISPERLRKRWKSESLARRLKRVRRDRADHALTTTASTSKPPGQQLATALSFLQRKTGMTIADTAAEIGISPSHLSRVLSGDRRPSWPVVLQFVEVCDGALPELRDLWEASHRPLTPDTPTRPDAPTTQAEARKRLHTALRALYLADGCRTHESLRIAVGDGLLTNDQIRDILAGRDIPDWLRTSRLIYALRGHPTDLLPLWRAATTSPPDTDTPRPHTSSSD